MEPVSKKDEKKNRNAYTDFNMFLLWGGSQKWPPFWGGTPSDAGSLFGSVF